MQSAIQFFDLGGQGSGTKPGGLLKIAVKMPLGDPSRSGHQDPTDFSAVMNMLTALPAEELCTSLKQLDLVPLGDAADQMVPVIDLTEPHDGGLQMVAEFLEAVGRPAGVPCSPAAAPGEYTLIPDAGSQPDSPAAAFEPAAVLQDAAALEDATPLERAPASDRAEADSQRALTSAVRLQTPGGPPLMAQPLPRTHAIGDAPPFDPKQAGTHPAAVADKGAAVSVKESDIPIGYNQAERGPDEKPGNRPSIIEAHGRSGVDIQPAAGGPPGIAVPPGRPSPEILPAAESSARGVAAESALTGIGQEEMPDTDAGAQFNTGGREQMGEAPGRLQSAQNAASEITAVEKQQPTARDPAVDIMRQIVDRMSLRTDRLQSHMQIRLKPEFLGDVRLQVSTENHQVMVRITADSQAVKEMIEQNVLYLKNELQQHGLQIDKFDVFVGTESGNFRQRRNPAAEHRSQNRNARSQPTDATQIQDALQGESGEIRQTTRGTVDFFA